MIPCTGLLQEISNTNPDVQPAKFFLKYRKFPILSHFVPKQLEISYLQKQHPVKAITITKL